MNVNKIIANIMEENCYIIKDGDVSAVIDPGGAAEKILGILEGTTLNYIMLTHGHFDHIIAVSELKRRTGAKVCISREDAAMLTDNRLNQAQRFGVTLENTEADKLVCDGDIIKIGSVKLHVIATPGHSEGSVCYYGDGVLFSGDTLFKRTIGKFDYENMSIMKNSISKLLELPDDTLVYPGHNEGTNIGFEKVHNPYAQPDLEWI